MTITSYGDWWNGKPPRRDKRDEVISVAQVEAELHQPESGVGCTCGFCAWSVEHVLVISMREALAHLPEWQCPDCGATTRARMADR